MPMEIRKTARLTKDVFTFCRLVCKPGDRFGWREMAKLWYKIRSRDNGRSNC